MAVAAGGGLFERELEHRLVVGTAHGESAEAAGAAPGSTGAPARAEHAFEEVAEVPALAEVDMDVAEALGARDVLPCPPVGA